MSKELLDGFDGTGSCDYHTTANLLTLDTTDKCTHVVTSLRLMYSISQNKLQQQYNNVRPYLVKLLVEHF